MMNGAMPSGSGSMPSTRWVMVALPASATSYTSAGSAPPSAHTSAASPARVSGQGPQPVQRRRVQHGRADPADHVRAERLLRVEHGRHRGRGPGGQVEQRRDHRRRAQVERDAEPAGRGVPGFHADQHVVHDHRGDLVVGARAAPGRACAARRGRSAVPGRPAPRAPARRRSPGPAGTARPVPGSASAPRGAGSPAARRRPWRPWAA